MKPKVGLYFNHYMYSDIDPYEIIAVTPSGKGATIREMSAVLDPTWKKDLVTGDLSDYCRNNNDQKWIITPDEKGTIVKIRKTKIGWRSPTGGRFILQEKPVKFYDYNF